MEEQAKLTLADYFDIHLDHAPKEGAELALDPIVLVARSIGGGRVNVVGLRLPEDEEEAAPLTRLQSRSSASLPRSGRRWQGSKPKRSAYERKASAVGRGLPRRVAMRAQK